MTAPNSRTDSGGNSQSELMPMNVSRALTFPNTSSPDRPPRSGSQVSMDTWDPLRGGRSGEDVFGKVSARLTFIGISSDWLFPPESVREFGAVIQASGVHADYREMTSDHCQDLKSVV